jgi:hypothetical protein
MKKAEENSKKNEAEKSIKDLRSQKIENGKNITGGRGSATEERINKGF